MNSKIMRITIIILLIAIFSISTCSSFGITKSIPDTLTLNEAILLALRHNPQIRSARLDRIVQKYAVIVAKHPFEANYSLNASAHYLKTNIEGLKTQSTTYNLQPVISTMTPWGTQVTLSSNNIKERGGAYQPSLDLKITQPLIKGFGKAVVQAALNNTLDQEEINQRILKRRITGTINTILRDYLTLIQIQENIRIDQASLKSYQQTVHNDKELIAAGHKAQSDIVQTQAQLASQKVVIQDDLNSLQNAKFQLLNDLGLDNNAPLKIPEQIDLKKIIQQMLGQQHLPSVVHCQKQALSHNLEYQIIMITQKTIDRNLRVAEDKKRWSLNLTVAQSVGRTLGDDLSETTHDHNSARTIDLELNIPIDDVNAQQELLAAQVALKQSKINLSAFQRQLEREAIQMRNTVLSSEKQWHLAQDALKLQKRAVEIAQLKQQEGRISTFELLNAQKDLIFAERNVITQAIHYIITLSSLDELLDTTLDRWNIQMKE